jgi:Mrp family chromosome partitioning ATPase
VAAFNHKYHDRYIIFDSAPVLLAADTLSLATYMDGLVFVVQADRTSPKTVEAALSLLKGYTILGSVFNNVPAYLGLGRHSYYYRYGGRYTMGNSPATNGGTNGPDPMTNQLKADSE